MSIIINFLAAIGLVTSAALIVWGIRSLLELVSDSYYRGLRLQIEEHSDLIEKILQEKEPDNAAAFWAVRELRGTSRDRYCRFEHNLRMSYRESTTPNP